MMTVGAAGNITGNVRDSSGAAVHNAEVLLATPGMAVVATARSDADGRFTIVAPVAGRYLLIVRAPAFGESRQAVTVDGSSSDPVSIVLQIGGFEEEVTVSAIRDHVDSLRVAAQPVNVITAEEIAERVQDGRCAGRAGRSGGSAAADESDDGRHFRPRPDGQQGQRVHRRRTLFERRAARRSEHVPRSDRTGSSRHHRSAARSLERAVRQRCARRQHSVLLQTAVAWRRRIAAVGRHGRALSGDRSPLRRRRRHRGLQRERHWRDRNVQRP